MGCIRAAQELFVSAFSPSPHPSPPSSLSNMNLTLTPLKSLLSRARLLVGAMSFNGSQDEFFRYTSGRWIRDESAQLSERYLKFDVNALKQAAVDACPGASSVTKMAKLPEGNFNKVFLIQLDNGHEVIARLPNPNAGATTLVTASEVATMEFVRTRLQVPVPRILKWCCEKQATPVGAEYIIMEKAAGVETYLVWGELSPPQKMAFVKAVAQMESKIAASHFAASGSLFFRDDSGISWNRGLKMSTVGVDDDFVVGPTVSLSLWEGERATMKLDRGPCEFYHNVAAKH